MGTCDPGRELKRNGTKVDRLAPSTAGAECNRSSLVDVSHRAVSAHAHESCSHESSGFGSTTIYTPGIRIDTTLRPSSFLSRELSPSPGYHIFSVYPSAHQARRRYGFPDLLFIVSNPSDQSRTPKLLLSETCAKGLGGCDEKGNDRRGFELITKGAEPLEAVKDSRFWIWTRIEMASRSKALLFVQNNFYYDAFFLNAIVMDGARSQTVRHIPSYRCSSWATSYHSLLTPYSFFGLGRTNNYIENLFVGSTKHTQEHFINMEGVIPNSRVVILLVTGHGEGSYSSGQGLGSHG
ncbi:hypothetical protein EV702DRAFT_1044074 [Suillus placidus]|uniref:T-cell immunomodulatory protein TIP C2 domain-containing protein n=1 Tax=Suillus placidus TaxID=48579 RepID=A0A9P6ZYG7_9AGAM|nr:hypothetical protein EV702DRAFT_1044074 [Suillus placidus]